MADDVRALSEVLARDPASLVYADLAEALRHRGDVDAALGVALRGLARHPDHVAGLDCAGRIHADRGDLAQAREAWGRALAIAPAHQGALRGMAFALFREGDRRGAEALLETALAANPGDEGARRALETVRRSGAGAPPPAAPARPPTPPAAPVEDAKAAPPAAEGADRPPVFREMDGGMADILLFDDRGLVVAGGLSGPQGADVAELAAAALAGVSGEAVRTAQYLSLGRWGTIVAESERANLVLAPVGAGALLLVRRDRRVPLGLTVRVAERAQDAARAWLERQGA